MSLVILTLMLVLTVIFKTKKKKKRHYILQVICHTWLHCEEICCICWSMQALICSISLNWLSLSFISSKDANFSSIIAKEAFSCATSLSLAWLDRIWMSMKALLLLWPLGLGPNITPWILPLCPLPSLWQTHHLVTMQCYHLCHILCLLWLFDWRGVLRILLLIVIFLILGDKGIVLLILDMLMVFRYW